jgi:hypothetical protein
MVNGGVSTPLLKIMNRIERTPGNVEKGEVIPGSRSNDSLRVSRQSLNGTMLKGKSKDSFCIPVAYRSPTLF